MACGGAAEQASTARLLSATAATEGAVPEAEGAAPSEDPDDAPVAPADPPDGGGPDAQEPPPPPDGEPEPAPAPPGDFAVPEVIDTAYAQRVMDALDHAVGEAARTVAEERVLGTDFFEHVVAVHQDRALSATVIPAWQSQAVAGLPDLADEPGDPVTTVASLERADPECIVVRAERDFNPIYRAPAPPEDVVIALVQTDRQIDPAFNPTPYVINWAAGPVEDPCA